LICRITSSGRTTCSLSSGGKFVSALSPYNKIAARLADRGIEPVIPPRSNRKTTIEYDREAYKRRNLIERCVNRLKQFRRIATRYEKTARAYLSMLSIAAARLWIKTVNTA
jgi:transposase